jgi:site-specific recombinase XerD
MTARTGHRIIQRAGEVAGLPFPVCTHQLHHACGYYLAAKGQNTRAIQAYPEHRNIQHTVKYTELSPGRFKDFWQD